MPTDFDFEPEPPRPKREPHSSQRPGAGSSWLALFTAVLAANILAGVILLVGVRLYIHWSVKDALDRMKNPPARIEK